MLQRLPNLGIFLILLLLVSAFVPGVADANNAPTANGTISAQTVEAGGNYITVNISSFFTDSDGDTLTYSVPNANVPSSNPNAYVSFSDTTLVENPPPAGETHLYATGIKETSSALSITVTATDPGGLTATQTFSLTVTPDTSVSGVTLSGTTNGFTMSWTAPSPTGYTLHATDCYDVEYRKRTESSWTDASHSGTTASHSVSGLTAGTYYQVRVRALYTSTSPKQTGNWGDYYGVNIPSTADATPGLSSAELSQLSALLTYDTLVINELHNGADDTTDWLELRNVSGTDIALDTWQLTIRTGDGTAVVPFPAGTVIPAGEVLLLTNTEMATADTAIASVVAETFVLPQADFALTLRSPTAFGDVAGNYFQSEGERPETAPAFTVNTVWARTQPIVFGYRADAWTESIDATGTPGYQPSAVSADLNTDGVVNILDLVLVASQFGTTGITAADLNGDGTVNMDDLVLAANAWGDVAAAPSAGQSSAAWVNTWLQLAQQHASEAVPTSLPDGFSYAHGIQVLEQLARALTPDTTALLANYPNPFNPETWIPYQLSKAADVSVTIYAADGHVVRTLALGHQKAGMYKNRSQAAYWDGKNELGETVASGLYFYTLTAGDFTATRRMLILK